MNYNENQRRIQRERRRQKRRRQRNLTIGVIVIVICTLLSSITIIFQNRKKQEELAIKEEQRELQNLQDKEIEYAKELLEQCYHSVLSEDTAVSVAETNDKSFSEWLFESFSENKIEKLLVATKDGELSEIEIYHSMEETLHVLSDRYEGLLKDMETAAQNNIYIREGKVKGEAEITIAGDLCLTEDGFVIDKYDTLNDLKQCISPEILKITNESDLFYINHEYTISDRGTPLAGKYYTFRGIFSGSRG